ncbi:Sporangia induced phosphatidyl inositol kinase, partial [Globisporangium splendens]
MTPRKLSHLATVSPSRSSSESPRLHVELPRTGWRSALWPSSPALQKKVNRVKTADQSSSPTLLSISNNHGLDGDVSVAPIPVTLRKQHSEEQPQDDGDNVVHVPESVDALAKERRSRLNLSTLLEKPLPLVKIRLHGGDIHVQSVAPQVQSKPKEVVDSAPVFQLPTTQALPSQSSLPLSPGDFAKWSSVQQELEEFRGNADSKILMFPDYLADDEKKLIKQIAEEMPGLGCQIGESNVAVFKTSSCEKNTISSFRPRKSALSLESGGGDDVYVDVADLAQQGKDCFIARLRLCRLSSGGGLRRNMLWDVAQLSKTDDGCLADPVHEGEGGVYAVQSRSDGQKLAMFKPAEEEKFVRDGLFPGEGAIREEGAYVLDSRSNGFSGVPPTAVARLQLSNIGKSSKQEGAVQRFMKSSIGSMDGFGMPFDLAKAEAFVLVEQVHRIGLLDIRVFNTDRHPGNILLIGEKAPYTMVPIDHGCILPSWFHLSEARFDWLAYPQCKVAFSKNSLDYIAALDADADAHAMRKLGIREECVTTLKICTMLLQIAARAGKTLHWIGSFMQREGCFEAPSQLELVIQQACEATSIPFTFVANGFNEQKGSIPLGILSRRPPKQFFDAFETRFYAAMTTPS